MRIKEEWGIKRNKEETGMRNKEEWGRKMSEE